MPSSSGLLVITIKLKSKCRLCIATMLFYSFQKGTLTKGVCILKIYYCTEFHNTTLSCSHITSSHDSHVDIVNGNEFRN